MRSCERGIHPLFGSENGLTGKYHVRNVKVVMVSELSIVGFALQPWRHFRIAIGPQAGRKVLTLQALLACDPEDSKAVRQVVTAMAVSLVCQ